MAAADVVGGGSVPGRSGFRVVAGGGCGEVACVGFGSEVGAPAERIAIAAIAKVQLIRIALINRRTRFVKASAKPAAGKRFAASLSFGLIAGYKGWLQRVADDRIT